MFSAVLISALVFAQAAFASPAEIPGLLRRSGHQLTIRNNCAGAVTPKIADTKCGYSPRKFSPHSGCFVFSLLAYLNAQVAMVLPVTLVANPTCFKKVRVMF